MSFCSDLLTDLRLAPELRRPGAAGAAVDPSAGDDSPDVAETAEKAHRAWKAAAREARRVRDHCARSPGQQQGGTHGAGTPSPSPLTPAPATAGMTAADDDDPWGAQTPPAPAPASGPPGAGTGRLRAVADEMAAWRLVLFCQYQAGLAALAWDARLARQDLEAAQEAKVRVLRALVCVCVCVRACVRVRSC
jgi:hypothetical protein